MASVKGWKIAVLTEIHVSTWDGPQMFVNKLAAICHRKAHPTCAQWIHIVVPCVAPWHDLFNYGSNEFHWLLILY